MAVPAVELGAPAGWIGLAVALGCGLLIGLERERRKRERRASDAADRPGEGPRVATGAAGIRSFTLVALLGALAQTLGQPLLVAAGAVAVLLLVALAYRASLQDDGDPGLTTEVALVATYLIGVLAVPRPALAGAAAVTVAVLLAARSRLHRLATRSLTRAELHDGLLLAALALVLLPLAPGDPVAWAWGLVPRQLVALWVLILFLQALAHALLRLWGPRVGFILGGLASGFVSSTATIAAMGHRARAEPAHLRACAAAAGASAMASWAQTALMLTALAPQVWQRWWAPGLAGMACAAGVALVLSRGAGAEGLQRRGGDGRGPLRVRAAATVALLLGVVTAMAAAVGRWLGPEATAIGLALAALADTHAAIGAWVSLHGAGQASLPQVVVGVLAALGANSVSRTVVAAVAGGPAYLWRVALALWLPFALAMAVWAAWH